MSDTRALHADDELPLAPRLLSVFHAPRRAFAAIRDGGTWQDWILPVLLVALVWAGHNLATLSVLAPETAAQLPDWESLSPEQQEMAARGLATWRSHGWLSMPVMGSLSSLAITALVLLGVARWILRVEVSLRQTLALKAYAELVTIPQWVVLTLLVRTGTESASPLSFSLGALLPGGATALVRFLNAVNLFDLWQGWVIAVGLAVMSGLSVRRTAGVVIGLWLAWAALGALMPAPPPPTAA